MDSERQQVTIMKMSGNIGGSFVTGNGVPTGENGLNSTSVLLSDIFDQIILDKYHGQKKIDIVMKIDIEQ